jgi:hypothetical protein
VAVLVQPGKVVALVERVELARPLKFRVKVAALE